MSRTSRLAFVVALLSSSLALAEAPGQEKGREKHGVPGIRILRGLRPDQPRTVSHQKPPMKRLRLEALSWGVVKDTERHQINTWTNHSRDPYKVTILDANEGTQLSVYKKGPAAPIQLPDPEGRAAQAETRSGRKFGLPASLRKKVNKEFNAAVRKAIATARPEEKLLDVTAPGPSSAQPTVVERPEVLATNTQLVVRGVDKFGRKYQAAYGTVQGLPAGENAWANNWQSVVEGGRRYSQRSRDRWGGIHAPSMAAQIVKENLRMTPVLERAETTSKLAKDPSTGKWRRVTETKRETYVKLLSLAGFSPSSQIVITNLRMQAEGNPAATRTIDRTNASGSGAIELPALLGDSFKIVVNTPRDANKQGSTTEMTVAVPRASKDGKYFADRYLPLP
jgi:hypothetical protein